MPQRGRIAWMLAGYVLLLGGCSSSTCLKCKGDPQCDPRKNLAQFSLAPGEKVVTPEEVQRDAVINNGVARSLQKDSEGEDRESCVMCGPGQKRTKLARLMKSYAADEARNQSAALALDAYYRLAEARLQIKLVEQGRDLAEKLVAKAEEYRKKGLEVPEDITALKRQASSTVSDRVKLELLRDRLTEQMRLLADGDLDTCQVGTVESFHVVDLPLDEAEALAIGLKYRPELNLLRSALCNLDASTLPLIRQLLGGSSPLLGDKVRRCVPLMECLPRILPLLARGELEKVRYELTTILCERERQVVSEVRQALRRIEATAKLAGLAQDREALVGKRLAELEERSGKGLLTDGDLPRARKDHVQARSDVLQSAIEWELARVELRRAQGLLVQEVLGRDRENLPNPCAGASPPKPPGPLAISTK